MSDAITKDQWQARAALCELLALSFRYPDAVSGQMPPMRLRLLLGLTGAQALLSVMLRCLDVMTQVMRVTQAMRMIRVMQVMRTSCFMRFVRRRRACLWGRLSR